MFIDLHKECLQLKSESVDDRVTELKNHIPGVHVVAVGGFPIKQIDGQNTWCGLKVTEKDIRNHIVDSLGLSATLTYMNTSNKSLSDLGNLCVNQKHTWAYHWLTLSILFCGLGKQVELALTRDSRFFMSWPVSANFGDVCVATGALKSWNKFISKRNSKDFPESVRASMYNIHTIVESLTYVR